MTQENAERFLTIEKPKIIFGFQEVDKTICSTSNHLTVVSFSRKEFRGVQDYLSDSVWKNKRVLLVLINSHFEGKISKANGFGTLTCFVVDDEETYNWTLENSIGQEGKVKIF